ncbi:MAG TPA: response regulator [Deltaproteobacteria bacterium]|nr:response regulator [Deltaproteobacteria bacterium]
MDDVSRKTEALLDELDALKGGISELEQRFEKTRVFARSAVNDFNNIVTSLLGNIALVLMSGELDDEVVKRLKAAERAALKAKNLTRQMLAFFNGDRPAMHPVQVAALVEGAVSSALIDSQASCRRYVPEDLPCVYVDESLMTSVLYELVTSAGEGGDGRRSIMVSADELMLSEGNSLGLEQGRYVRIGVRDDGPGIPPEMLDRVFDPDYLSPSGRHGLGLFTALHIVKSHGGTMRLESRVGQGTTAFVYLPVSEEKEEGRAASAPLVTDGKILVMEDEEAVCTLLDEMLSPFGHDVVFARNGDEALRRYDEALRRNEPFDAVLMDLTIVGGMDGREAIKRLREMDPNVKAIVSSGQIDDPIMSDYKKHGFCYALAKPYTVAELRNALHNVLGGGAGA